MRGGRVRGLKLLLWAPGPQPDPACLCRPAAGRRLGERALFQPGTRHQVKSSSFLPAFPSSSWPLLASLLSLTGLLLLCRVCTASAQPEATDGKMWASMFFFLPIRHNYFLDEICPQLLPPSGGPGLSTLHRAGKNTHIAQKLFVSTCVSSH